MSTCSMESCFQNNDFEKNFNVKNSSSSSTLTVKDAPVNKSFFSKKF